MKKIIPLFAVMAILWSFPFKGLSAVSEVKEPSYKVEIVKTDNSQMTVPAFRRLYVSNAIYSTRYSDVPEVTKTHYSSVMINTGRFSAELPFQIISSIDILSTGKDYGPQKATVFLGDGTKVEGSIWGTFVGETGLGAAEFRIHSLRSIIFKHRAAAQYSGKAISPKTATAFFDDGSTLTLAGAAFLSEQVNKNGCFVKDDHPESFKFNCNDTEYQISWSKVKAIIPQKRSPNSSIVINQTQYTLITKDGAEYKGYSPYIPNVTEIDGVASIFGQYRLRVIFSFFGFYSRIELN